MDGTGVVGSAERGQYFAPYLLDCLGASLEYIERSLEWTPCLDDICRRAMMSKFHFSRIFHTATGFSPLVYQRARNMTRASHMLRDGACSIDEVAAVCGYEDRAAFGRSFKRHFGLSPARYALGGDPLWGLHCEALGEGELRHWHLGGIESLGRMHMPRRHLVGVWQDFGYDGDFAQLYHSLISRLSAFGERLDGRSLWLFQEWDEDGHRQCLNRYFLGVEKSFGDICLESFWLPATEVQAYSHRGASRECLHHSFRYLFRYARPERALLRRGWMVTEIIHGDLSREHCLELGRLFLPAMS